MEKKVEKVVSEEVLQRRKGARTKRRKARSEQLGRQLEALKKGAASGLSAEDIKALGGLIKGRGDYTIGRSIGEKAGGWIGNKLEGFVRKIFGTGDYSINPPQDVRVNSLTASNSIPTFGDTSGGTVIEYHEFIGNLNMTSSFAVSEYPIDITSALTFPWASNFAANYQQWSLDGCVFFIKSLSSNTAVAPTQGMGSIFATTLYQVGSLPPTSKADMLNTMFATSAKPSDNQAIAVECAGEQTTIKTLLVARPGIDPDQFNRLGTLYIATEGAPNDYADAAELWVTYRLRFLKPQSNVNRRGPFFWMDLAGTDTSKPILPIADTALVKQPRFNSMGLTVGPSYSQLVFPLSSSTESLWLLGYHLSGAATSNVATIAITGAGGMTQAVGFADQQLNKFRAPDSTTNTGLTNISWVGLWFYGGNGTAVAPPALNFALGSSTVPGTMTGGTLFIFQIDPGCGSGLREAGVRYSRVEFFGHLCSVVAGRRAVNPPPIGSGRLVDWLEIFKKYDAWPAERPVPRCAHAFDVTYIEAMATMSKYVPLTYSAVVESSESKSDLDFVDLRLK